MRHDAKMIAAVQVFVCPVPAEAKDMRMPIALITKAHSCLYALVPPPIKSFHPKAPETLASNWCHHI